MDVKTVLSNPILLFALGLILQFVGGLLLSGPIFVVLLAILWKTKRPLGFYVLGAIVGWVLLIVLLLL